MHNDTRLMRISGHLSAGAAVYAAMVKSAEFMAQIAAVAEAIEKALSLDKTVYFIGNGGSAADAQHMAAEFVGRYRSGSARRRLRGVSLTTDTSFLTAEGNDAGFEHIFESPVDVFASEGDVLFAISTSGNSTNILRAIEAGRRRGMVTVGLLGEGGGEAGKMVDYAICVPSRVTAHAQEAHIAVLHAICECLEP